MASKEKQGLRNLQILAKRKKRQNDLGVVDRKLESERGTRCRLENFAIVLYCSVKVNVMEYTEIQRGPSGGLGSQIWVQWSSFLLRFIPFFHLKDVITLQQCAHTLSFALPAVVIQFRRLERRDREIEGAKREAEG